MNSKKKILHITASMNPLKGGVATAIATLAIELDKLQFINEIVCLDGPDSAYLETTTL